MTDAQVQAQTLRISRLHWPVTVLGHGRRAGIWVQGCSIHCTGCVSRDTWDPSAGEQMRVDEVAAWVRARGDEVDGVTISGGEPFEQGEGLLALLRALEPWRAQRALTARPVDLLAYSGFPYATVRRRYPAALDLLDAVVTEPFVQSRAEGLPLRGSANQHVRPLSDLGRARYATAAGDDLTVDASAPRLQVSAEPGTLWYIGIPRPGDLDRMEALMRERGVVQGKVSWRA